MPSLGSKVTLFYSQAALHGLPLAYLCLCSIYHTVTCLVGDQCSHLCSWLNSTEQRPPLMKICYLPTANSSLLLSDNNYWMKKIKVNACECQKQSVQNLKLTIIKKMISQKKTFPVQYLEANWHCWIYFRFYLLVEIWQVTSYHQQDPYGHPVCHPGWYQTGCMVTLLGSYQGPL